MQFAHAKVLGTFLDSTNLPHKVAREYMTFIIVVWIKIAPFQRHTPQEAQASQPAVRDV